VIGCDGLSKPEIGACRVNKDPPKLEDSELYESLREVLRRGGYSRLDRVGRRPLRLTLEAFRDAWTRTAWSRSAVVAFVGVLAPISTFTGMSPWVAIAGAAVGYVLAGGASLIAYEPATVGRTFHALGAVVTAAQLVFALIVLVVFALVLTAEVWRAASTESGTRLAVLAALIIAPEFLLLRHRLVQGIKPHFEKTAEATAVKVGKGGTEADEVVGDALKEARHLGGERAERLEKAASSELKSIFEKESERDTSARKEVVEAFYKQLSATLRLRVTARLVFTVLAVALVASAAVYLIAAIAVTPEVGAEWAALKEIPHRDVAGVALPVGPYVQVAVMLAILASGVFLGFIITNSNLSDELRNAYVDEMARAVWLLGVPCDEVGKRLETSRANDVSAAAAS